MSNETSQERKIDMEDYWVFVDEFRSESDRAAVILGAAKLDLLLYQILRSFLAPNTTNRDELLDGDSPLGTFSAKISICHRLGLIDNEFTRALHLTRKIRNAFAHEVSGCSLNSGAHRDRVKELVTPLKHMSFFTRLRDQRLEGKDEPSANFRTALAIFVARLETLLNHVDPMDTSKALCIINNAMREMGEAKNPRRPAETSQQSYLPKQS